MSESQNGLIQRLYEKAKALPITVVEAKNYAEAMQYVVKVCEEKAPCEILVSKEGEEYGPLNENRRPTSLKRVIAAPELDPDAMQELEKLTAAKGFTLMKDGLRNSLGGFDVSIAHAQMAVADSATCVVQSNREELRLATMIAEISILMVPKSRVVAHLEDTAQLVRDLTGGVAYTAFITGPSRTADIERVTALGVHGPLELHIILLEA